MGIGENVSVRAHHHTSPGAVLPLPIGLDRDDGGDALFIDLHRVHNLPLPLGDLHLDAGPRLRPLQSGKGVPLLLFGQMRGQRLIIPGEQPAHRHRSQGQAHHQQEQSQKWQQGAAAAPDPEDRRAPGWDHHRRRGWEGGGWLLPGASPPEVVRLFLHNGTSHLSGLSRPSRQRQGEGELSHPILAGGGDIFLQIAQNGFDDI